MRIHTAKLVVAQLSVEQPHMSVDSAPPGFAVHRSPWVTPVFLLAFALISTAALLTLPRLEEAYELALTKLAGAQLPTDREPLSLRFRPFFGALVLTFCLFAAGPFYQRLKLLLLMTALYVGAVVLVDAALLRASQFGGPGPFSAIGNIVAGFAVLVAFTAAILTSVRLPRGVRVATVFRRPRRYGVVLFASLACAAVLVALILRYAGKELQVLRDVALIGGLGPGVLLFNPIFWSLLAVVALVSQRGKRHDVLLLSVAFLVPAFNESRRIAECIRSLDEAAANYPGPCRLYVVDDGSSDGTGEVARKELARCRALDGEVYATGGVGKAGALNLGLKHITEDIIVRVDADTAVLASLLTKLIPHFSDPAVGGVGGLPIPRDESHLLGRMRAIEVYHNIGFLRFAQRSVDGVMVIPGMLSVYRRELLLKVGGFAEGLNGEDTDVTVRIGRLGYRIVPDPSIHVFSEAPRTLGHLRDQRLRWTRGFLHVMARNRSAIWMRQGARGVWTFPLAFANAFRRVIVVPVLIYAGISAIFDPSALFLRHGIAIVAVIVGPALLLTLGVLVAYRRFDLVPFIPAFLGFRLLRAYLNLEMLFTLPLKTAVGRVKGERDTADLPPEFLLR